ncbi:MAG: hypothetical protein DRP42_00220 [Tenericutes bacterium]|nr:MAG: hypothetical protein DRP42_00220 [Mycoplasmatota bacterium]
MTLLLGSILTSIFILFGVYSLASSSVLVSERSGTVNISIEGTMIMGAITQLVLLSPNGAGMIELGVVGILLSLLVAGAIGSIFGLLLGIAVITFKGDHVIVGTALNLLAPVLSLMIAITVFGTTSGGNSPPSPLRPGNFDYLSLVFMGIGIMVLFGSWFYLAKTKSGLRLKSAGENPYSLETAGVSVSRQRYMALIVAGFLGGMSGAMASHTFTNFQHTVTGMGFIAIAILIFGQ